MLEKLKPCPFCGGDVKIINAEELTINHHRSGGERVMGYKYTVYASRYPYNGWWEIDKGFETLNEAIEYAKKCQSKYEAREVLASLATAIDRENQYFEFPRSLNQDTLERKRDARTKRKGGS